MKLIACPECRRQHNVAGLDPGSQVRCVCDALLDVGLARDLPVQGLVCAHCGAPCGPGSLACTHCGVALSELDRKATLLCPACGVRLPDDSRYCRGCAIELRPQALLALPEGTRCPRCRGQLRVRVLGASDTVPWDVIECADCGGLWFEPQDFDRVCHSALRAPGLSFLPEDMRASSSQAVEAKVAYIPCLRCSDFMQRRVFRHAGGNSRIVLDHCRRHGVWLDYQELGQVLEFLRTHRPNQAISPAPMAQYSPPANPNPRFDASHSPTAWALEAVWDLLWFVGDLFTD